MSVLLIKFIEFSAVFLSRNRLLQILSTILIHYWEIMSKNCHAFKKPFFAFYVVKQKKLYLFFRI